MEHPSSSPVQWGSPIGFFNPAISIKIFPLSRKKQHERSWGISRQLCKPSTSSRDCITVENSSERSSVYIRLYKYREKVFYCFYKLCFPRKNAKLFVMALIKREILTSREVLKSKRKAQCEHNNRLKFVQQKQRGGCRTRGNSTGKRHFSICMLR